MKLQNYIKSFTTGNKSVNNNLNLDKEFRLFQATGKRTDGLEKLYKALLTIKPTSTASERVFSVSGVFKNKLRNKLSCEVLDALVFLKYYFANQ